MNFMNVNYYSYYSDLSASSDRYMSSKIFFISSDALPLNFDWKALSNISSIADVSAASNDTVNSVPLPISSLPPRRTKLPGPSKYATPARSLVSSMYVPPLVSRSVIYTVLPFRSIRACLAETPAPSNSTSACPCPLPLPSTTEAPWRIISMGDAILPPTSVRNFSTTSPAITTSPPLLDAPLEAAKVEVFPPKNWDTRRTDTRDTEGIILRNVMLLSRAVRAYRPAHVVPGWGALLGIASAEHINEQETIV
mmetsp:Transcript_22236/g.37157  ORF Transcript_22236/g.37157 Transcript_22236/m.37157 type:complete len:252 (+) Transcript_22236:131-886(+)